MMLTPEQDAAVRRSGQDVCVVAGPGSGKTRVLVERFRWLTTQGISPLRILAITFTDKAANEVKRRLVTSFADQPEKREEIERAYVSTVHGFCARLLRENAIAAGLDPRFQVLDERASEAERAAAAVAALDRLYHETPDALRALFAAWHTQEPLQALQNACEQWRTAGGEGLRGAGSRRMESLDALVTEVRQLAATMAAAAESKTEPQRRRRDGLLEWSERAAVLAERPVTTAHFLVVDGWECSKRGLKEGDPVRAGAAHMDEDLLPRLRQALVEEAFATERTTLTTVLADLHTAYQDAKRQRSGLDFADLEQSALRLLRDEPEVRGRVQESFDAILMDELQDTNPVQWELIHLLRRPGRFFGVGDMNQSIYGFRRANPALFSGYRESIAANGAVDRLERNYRSRLDVLAATQAILAPAAGIEPHQLLAGRDFPERGEPAVEVIVAHATEDREAPDREAAWVARRMRDLEGTLLLHPHGEPTRPARFADMAVLVRNSKSLDAFERSFQAFGVPYVMARGKGFFEEQEVCDLVHFLRVLADPEDELSLLAVLRSPLVGVHDESVLLLRRHGTLGAGVKQFTADPFDLYPEGDRERLWHFREQLQLMRPAADDISPDRLLARVLDEADYETGLPNRARANIDKLLTLVRDLRCREHRPLCDIVRELARMRASQRECSAPATEAANAVQVLTIHNAKGLEFPVVFVASLNKGALQETPDLCWSPDHGLGVKWRNPATQESEPDSALAAYVEATQEREEREADRLLYVALTRAEEHLVLSYGRTKTRRAWPLLIEQGLAFDPDTLDSAPVNHAVPGQLLSVRLWRTNHDPAPLDGGIVEAAPEPALLERPVPVDLYDSSAPVTEVVQFRKCARQYYLERYVGWPATGAVFTPDEDDERPAFDFDEVVIAGRHGGTELGLEVHEFLSGERKTASTAARELAERFERSELGRRVDQAARVEKEFKLVFVVEELILRGQIDLWFTERDGSLVVVDYKSDDIDLKLEKQRVDFYRLQLRLYALALEQLQKRVPTEAVLYFLRPNQAVPVSLRPGDLQEARKVVNLFRQAQARQHFPPTASPLCRSCAFHKAMCPVNLDAGMAAAAGAPAQGGLFRLL